MYQWEKQRTSLNTVAGRVLRIERSIADVQVSLPGLAPEHACAYVCAYHDGEGIRIAIVLHLLQSDQLAFYMNLEGPLDSEAAERELGEGLKFAESLGFTLGDLDSRRLSPDQQGELWSSLAFFLSPGATPEARQSKVPPDTSKRGADPAAVHQAAVRVGAKPDAQQLPTTPKNVEPLRPTVEEMMQRRKVFIQNLGRLLGMF
jgi:hypothetical protein